MKCLYNSIYEFEKETFDDKMDHCAVLTKWSTLFQRFLFYFAAEVDDRRRYNSKAGSLFENFDLCEPCYGPVNPLRPHRSYNFRLNDEETKIPPWHL